MTPRQLVLSAIAAALLSVAGCGDIYLEDSQARSLPKETGPLTVPPRAVRDGTSR
jgi:predicted small lipoprotein YifL